MARRRSGLPQRKTGLREYRDVCWVSTEGTTERDYLQMEVFKGSAKAVKFPQNVHPNRHNPAAVLKRFEKALRENDFRKSDEAWLVIDIDEWDGSEIAALLEWETRDPRHHLAVSNPKFELFLLMHYEKANGCTTPEKVDVALRKYWPGYDKRISRTHFSGDQIGQAVENAKSKRASCKEALPAAGMTDVYKLVERLLPVNDG